MASEASNAASLIKKVKDLRALAARAGTPAEAEAAAAAAERIIVQHMIDEAAIAASESRAEELPAEGDPIWEGTSTKVWINMLAGGLAKMHGCAVLILKESRGRKTLSVKIRIAGTKTNIELVRYLFAWLTLEIERFACREHGTSARNSFRVGAVCGVLSAMEAGQKTELRAQPQGKSTEMVLVSQSAKARDVLVRSAKGKIGRSSGASLHDGAAFDRGKKVGEGISQRHGLKAGETRLALPG